jgi:histidinol-phosphatase (PHP family)
MIFYDMHTHSDISPDAYVPLEEMCEAALSHGIKAIAVTDHLDAYSQFPFGMMWSHKDLYHYDAEAARAAVAAAQYRFNGKIDVLYGVELGQPHHNPGACVRFIETHDFDVVIGSLHCRNDGEDYFSIDYKGLDLDFTLNRYLDSTLVMIRWGRFDILAHMDYILCYVALAGLTLDLQDYSEKVCEILKQIIKKDIALEINTSGARYPTGVRPEVWVLKAFRELGGKLLTIGTDSHMPSHFAIGVEDAFSMAKQAGFTEAVYYKKRTPYFYALN